MNTKHVTDFLFTIGLSPSYRGYQYLTHVICLATSYHGQPFPCIKDLCQETAEYFHVPSTGIITDNIRTLLRNYWDQDNASTFTKITGYPVKDKLTTKEFIAVSAEYLMNHYK